MSVCIGGDSSPASAHGSPLKWTRLHALSRGFIPGGIMASSGMETRFIVGYRNPTYKSGIPIPPISLSVKDDAVSKRRNGSVFVCIGGDSSPASAHGSPLKWTRRVGFNRLACIEQGIYPRRNCGIVGYRNPSYCWLWKSDLLSVIETRPTIAGFQSRRFWFW